MHGNPSPNKMLATLQKYIHRQKFAKALVEISNHQK
jgi:hypothetical protein